MRREDKAITDLSEIQSIIDEAMVVRVGLSDGTQPYVVPMCFGFSENTLYLHSATEGKKLDLIRKNPLVAFEMETQVDIKESDKPCSWSMTYKSIIGQGCAEIIDEPEEKKKGLSVIMAHYSEKPFEFQENAVAKTVVIKVSVSEITGKRSGI